nr:hypothetical protein [uncultured Flavobacterium sp.]
MESIITIIIYIHAFFGSIGLIAGIASVSTKKGSYLHRKAGKLFTFGMVTSSTISLTIAIMPNHKNIILLLIGIFTLYLVLSGNRALTFKNKTKVAFVDYFISGSMLLCCIIMISLGIFSVLKNYQSGTILLIFGILGLYLSIKDFILYRNILDVNKNWLMKHAGKMTGALISSITAFLVAGIGISNLIVWIMPSVLGGIYIVYWANKITNKRKLASDT